MTDMISMYEPEKNQQSDRLILLGQMATGLIHEMKNPLTVIKGFCEIIKKVSREDNIKDYIMYIDDETERINKVICDFLRFAKPRIPIMKEIAIKNLIESIRIVVDANTFIKGINIEYDLTDNDLKILADADQIRQVVLNIVQNGIEAMGEEASPCMKIRTGRDKTTDEAYITITNNGKPIPAEDIVKLGTPFFTTKEKGTGLGLSISYQIINEHNGRIVVDSSERETSFTILLPCCSSTGTNDEQNVTAV